MSIKQLAVAGVTTLALLAFTSSLAEEITKQTAASRQVSKARGQVNQDNDGSANFTSGITTSPAGQKEGDNTPLLDSGAMDKAAKETSDTLKKMDKVLDGF